MFVVTLTVTDDQGNQAFLTRTLDHVTFSVPDTNTERDVILSLGIMINRCRRTLE